MDDPNITMEEYIRLEEEKAQKHGKVFNWETAKYGKIWYDEDIHDLRSVETEFPVDINKKIRIGGSWVWLLWVLLGCGGVGLASPLSGASLECCR
ncbi:hypothetical protein Tco_0646121 [Tanacetum coccineum]